MVHRGRDKLIEELMQSAVELAWALNRGMEKQFCGQRHLTFSRLMVLRLLADRGSCHVSDVAAFLGVSDADASMIVDKLVGRKLLQRVESRSDRRIRELSLTPSARQLLSDYERARKCLLADEFRKCSAEELHHASAILDRVSWCIASHGRTADGEKKAGPGELHRASRGSGPVPAVRLAGPCLRVVGSSKRSRGI